MPLYLTNCLAVLIYFFLSFRGYFVAYMSWKCHLLFFQHACIYNLHQSPKLWVCIEISQQSFSLCMLNFAFIFVLLPFWDSFGSSAAHSVQCYLGLSVFTGTFFREKKRPFVSLYNMQHFFTESCQSSTCEQKGKLRYRLRLKTSAADSLWLQPMMLSR